MNLMHQKLLIPALLSAVVVGAVVMSKSPTKPAPPGPQTPTPDLLVQAAQLISQATLNPDTADPAQYEALAALLRARGNITQAQELEAFAAQLRLHRGMLPVAAHNPGIVPPTPLPGTNAPAPEAPWSVPSGPIPQPLVNPALDLSQRPNTFNRTFTNTPRGE